MSTPLTVNGVVYQYPQNRDVDWGQQATAWATAITSGMLQKAGGSFVLTADADFGPNFGLKVVYLKSRAANVASAGIIRLGNTENIEWRNAANNADVRVFVDSDDRLYYQNGADPVIDLTAAAGGNVTGPGSSTDNAIARFNGISGQVIQNSGVLVEDDNDITGVKDLDMSGDITFGADDVVLSNALVPIGTVIWHYDFNGALVPNSTYWVPCDGGSYTIGGSSRTTPDLSGVYIVGFGTPGAGDIDTAAWATGFVGNTDHEIDIEHSHTVNAHQHTGNTGTTGLTTNTDGAHQHQAGTIAARLDAVSDGSNKFYIDPAATSSWNSEFSMNVNGTTNPDTSSRTSGVECTGSTANDGAHQHTIAGHSHTIVNESPGTDNQLSTTQSIQPQSVRMRAYMRAK